MKTGMILRTALFAWMVGTTLVAQQVAAPVTPVRQIPDYNVGVNDVFHVDVFSGQPQPTYSRSYTVQNNGKITLPDVGELFVLNMTTLQIQDAIKKKLSDEGYFMSPIVIVIMEQYRSAELRVDGAVRSPGTIQLTAEKMRLVEAINKAGIITTEAGPKVKIKRANGVHPDPAVTIDPDGWEEYSTNDLMDGKLDDVRVFAGDAIKVEMAKKFIVNGFVRSIGSYNWAPGMTLQRAVSLAGGVNENGAMNRATVKRKVGGDYVEVKLSKNKGSTPIEPEDIIEVPKRRM